MRNHAGLHRRSDLGPPDEVILGGPLEHRPALGGWARPDQALAEAVPGCAVAV
jgi:hypothetical protein